MRYVIPIVLAVLWGAPSLAEDASVIAVTLKDHRFSPAEIHVPAEKRVVLTVRNEDSTAEEFDSSALKVEKVIAAGKTASIRLRPLKPGQYPFMGEYNAATAQGVIIVE